MARSFAHRVCALVTVALASWTAVPCAADIVVVVGSQSEVKSLTPEQVAEIYLGRLSSATRDIKLRPVEQSEKALKEVFHRHITGKTPNQLRAYWARRVFAGQDNPPAEVKSSAVLKTLLAGDAALVGYMPRADVDNNVRIVLATATP